MKIYDVLWKGIIEDLPNDAITFFFPDAADVIDPLAEVEFLDKELNEILPKRHHVLGKSRHVDKLLKVQRRDGKDQWLLLHFEVQGQPDAHFAERMFVYHIRIRERYKREVAAIAILTDKSADFRPSSFSYETLGTSLQFNYRVYKVLDQTEAELLASDNPFASVVLTALLNIKKNASNAEVIRLGIEIMRNLMLKGFDAQKRRAVMHFLKNAVAFKPEETAIFAKELESINQKELPMGIEEAILAIERKKAEIKGVKLGKALGEKQGIKKGERLGMEKGEKQGIEKGIEKGKLKQASQTAKWMQENGFPLEKIAEALNVSKEEVQGYLAR
jgi:predicted transposase YdaD